MRKNIIVIILIFVAAIVAFILINFQREQNRTTAIINLLEQYQTQKTSQGKKQVLTEAIVSYRRNLPIRLNLSFSRAEDRESRTWCDNLWAVIQNVAAQIDTETLLQGPGSVGDNQYVESMDALIRFWLDHGCFYYE